MPRVRSELRRKIIEAVDGACIGVVLHGASGSGRTTLIQECLRAAQRENLAQVSTTDGDKPRPWDEILIEWSEQPSVIALEGHAHTPLANHLLDHGRPGLILIRSNRPVKELEDRGVVHMSPPPLSIEELGIWLDFEGTDRRQASTIHKRTRGLPGAVAGVLGRNPVPTDLDAMSQSLLEATHRGPVTVEDLAQLGISEHALLDLAEPLLDRGLLTEVDKGAALAPSR
jgi:hypothetical protein